MVIEVCQTYWESEDPKPATCWGTRLKKSGEIMGKGRHQIKVAWVGNGQ